MKKLFFFLILAFFTTQSYAIVCPVGFNQVNVGDTVDMVTQQCGKPDSLKTTKEPPFQPQEWVFYVKPDPKQSGSVKLTVGFDKDKKAVNITVNAQSLVKTPLCGGVIQTGDSTDVIKTICGNPVMINQSQQTPALSAEVETIVFTYNTVPTTTMTFVGGKLVSRK